MRQRLRGQRSSILEAPDARQAPHARRLRPAVWPSRKKRSGKPARPRAGLPRPLPHAALLRRAAWHRRTSLKERRRTFTASLPLKKRLLRATLERRPGLEQFHFETALATRRCGPPQHDVDSAKNDIFWLNANVGFCKKSTFICSRRRFWRGRRFQAPSTASQGWRPPHQARFPAGRPRAQGGHPPPRLQNLSNPARR